MTVKAKFKCVQVADINYGAPTKPRKVNFSAVYGTSGENADYAKYTPSGNLELCIDEGTQAFDFFQPGKEYYLLFEEAQ